MEREKIIEVLTHYYKQGEALGYSNAELSRIRSCINKVEAIADELEQQPAKDSDKRKRVDEWLFKNYHEFTLHCKNTGRSLPFFYKMLEQYHNESMPTEEKLREIAKRFEENVYEDMMSPKSIWFIGAIWVKNYINNK